MCPAIALRVKRTGWPRAARSTLRSGCGAARVVRARRYPAANCKLTIKSLLHEKSTAELLTHGRLKWSGSGRTWTYTLNVLGADANLSDALERALCDEDEVIAPVGSPSSTPKGMTI